MTSELNLINLEQLANTLFLISTLYSYASADEAKQRELEKLQLAPASSTSPGKKSAQYALLSTVYSFIAYVIFTLIAVARKNQLQEENAAGTSNTSVAPIANIAIGFAVSLLGVIIRLPAIQQRVREAREVIF